MTHNREKIEDFYGEAITGTEKVLEKALHTEWWPMYRWGFF
jgi:hypothetical protein